MGATCACMMLLLYNYFNARVAGQTETPVLWHGNRKHANWDARTHIRAVVTNSDSSHIKCCSPLQSNFLRNCTPPHISLAAAGCHEVKGNKMKHNSTIASTVTTAAHLPTWAGGVPPNWSCTLLSRTGGASHTPTLSRSHNPTFLNAKSIGSTCIMKIPQQMRKSSLTAHLLLFFSEYCT